MSWYGWFDGAYIGVWVDMGVRKVLSHLIYFHSLGSFNLWIHDSNHYIEWFNNYSFELRFLFSFTVPFPYVDGIPRDRFETWVTVNIWLRNFVEKIKGLISCIRVVHQNIGRMCYNVTNFDIEIHCLNSLLVLNHHLILS